MAINVKDAETTDVIRRLAEATGESLTGAIEAAVRERLEHVEREHVRGRSAEDLLAIGRDAAARLARAEGSTDHDAALYGPDGLPR